MSVDEGENGLMTFYVLSFCFEIYMHHTVENSIIAQHVIIFCLIFCLNKKLVLFTDIETFATSPLTLQCGIDFRRQNLTSDFDV